MPLRIEGTHDGRRIVVPLKILPPLPSTDLTGIDARGLLDTGATTSGIAARIARRLELVSIGKRPLGYARGEMQVDRFIFRIGLQPDGDAPAFPFMFEEMIGFELSDAFSLDALIGMDILRRCDLSVRRDGRWSLSFG